MFRILFVSFVLVFLGSLTIPFEGVHASTHRDARNSMTPTEEMKYDPGPFNDPAAFGIQNQKK